MNDFAATHRRWGYKRAWARAKSEGIVVGRDTFRRLWRAEGLRVRPRKGACSIVCVSVFLFERIDA